MEVDTPLEARERTPWQRRARAECDDTWCAASKDLEAADEATEQAMIAGLAATLDQLIRQAGPQRTGASRFHAQQLPSLSISDYVMRLHKYFKCSLECFVVAMAYMDRVTQRHPEIQVCGLTCHRLLAASLTLAAKFLEDVHYSNKYYSHICGMQLQELNNLERAMMAMLRAELVVKPEEFEAYRRVLTQVGGRCLS